MIKELIKREVQQISHLHNGDNKSSEGQKIKICVHRTLMPPLQGSQQGHNAGTVRGIITKFKLHLCIVVKNTV